MVEFSHQARASSSRPELPSPISGAGCVGKRSHTSWWSSKKGLEANLRGKHLPSLAPPFAQRSVIAHWLHQCVRPFDPAKNQTKSPSSFSVLFHTLSK